MQMMEYMKEHPYVTAGIALVGGVILYTIFFSGGSSGTPTQAQVDAANFATQTQGATDLAVAQAAEQASQYQTDAQAKVASDYINGQVSLANIAANVATNAQTLQAGVQNSAIAGSVQENLAQTAGTVQIATLQQQLGMATVNAQENVDTAQINATQNVQDTQANNNYNLSLQALADAYAAPHPSTVSTPLLNLTAGGTYTTPPPSPPPPPPPPPAPPPPPPPAAAQPISSPDLLHNLTNGFNVAINDTGVSGGAAAVYQVSSAGVSPGPAQTQGNLLLQYSPLAQSGPSGFAEMYNLVYGGGTTVMEGHG